MKVPFKKFSKDAFIYISGKAPPKEFFIVKSGQIKIKKKNPMTGVSEEIKGPGYIFGIIQCVTGIKENVTAQSITDSEIFIIKKNEIETLFANHKKVILKILSEYSEILRKLDSDLINYNFFYTSDNRREKILDIAKKYIAIKQEKKAAHLLHSIIKEFPDDKDTVQRARTILAKLPELQIIPDNGIIYETTIPKDTVIFAEFELSQTLFIIKKGKIKISKLKQNKDTTLAILNEGDVFGEMSVLNDKPRNAAAVAVEDSRLMIIHKSGIDRLPPPIFVKILEVLSQRIWLVQQQLICYKLPTITAKLYYLLVAKIKQKIPNPKQEADNSFKFKFPVEELYQMIDYEYNIVNKTEVDDFLNDTNIEFTRESIKIKNIGKLLDKKAYHFSRALIIYNSTAEELH